MTSLAATGWTDTEWVNGGVSGVQGVTASTFNVNQNTTTATDGTGWVDFPTTPGNTMSFSADATGLVPGKTVYAFVRLRTVVKSLSGDLTLSAATMNTGSSALFTALRYTAKVMPDQSTCNSTSYVATGSYLVGDSTTDHALTDAGTSPFNLAAGTSSLAGAEKTVCFALNLPYPQVGTTLQGLSTTPTWSFTANSI